MLIDLLDIGVLWNSHVSKQRGILCYGEFSLIIMIMIIILIMFYSAHIEVYI